MRSKLTPRKVGVGLERRRELSKQRWNWRLAWRGSTQKKTSHLLGLREEDTSTQTSAPIKSELLVWPLPQQELKRRRIKWPDRQHREQLAEESRKARKIVDEERKQTGLRTDPCEIPRQTRK